MDKFEEESRSGQFDLTRKRSSAWKASAVGETWFSLLDTPVSYRYSLHNSTTTIVYVSHDRKMEIIDTSRFIDRSMTDTYVRVSSVHTHKEVKDLKLRRWEILKGKKLNIRTSVEEIFFWIWIDVLFLILFYKFRCDRYFRQKHSIIR